MRWRKANSGHPGMPMGMADVATVLFSQFLKFDSQHPDWPDRDRFVLSAGHGSMLLYALLYLTGYPQMTIDEIQRFRQIDSKTPGHPSTDILRASRPRRSARARSRQCVGMALAERMLNARHGDALVDHYTYCIAGDGCLMEGISHEAISLGRTSEAQQADRAVRRQPHLDRRADRAHRLRRSGARASIAHGWNATRVDGHDPKAVPRDRRAHRIRQAEHDRLPHHDRLRRPEEGATRRGARLAARQGGDRRRSREARLEIPAVRDPARHPQRLARSGQARPSRLRRLDQAPCGLPPTRPSSTAPSRDLPEGFAGAVNDIKNAFAKEAPKLATRNPRSA
jgi:transketolase